MQTLCNLNLRGDVHIAKHDSSVYTWTCHAILRKKLLHIDPTPFHDVVRIWTFHSIPSKKMGVNIPLALLQYGCEVGQNDFLYRSGHFK